MNDAYLGSGKFFQRALKKYGVENFRKEVLHVFDNEDDMNSKEAEIVTEEFCAQEDTYNICPGGKGGWGYVNKLKTPEEFVNNGRKGGIKGGNSFRLRLLNDEHFKKRISEICSLNATGRPVDNHGVKNPMFGKKHSVFTKNLMSSSHKGSLNSQFGSMWITDGVLNKKIKKGLDVIPEGWYKGMVVKTKIMPD